MKPSRKGKAEGEEKDCENAVEENERQQTSAANQNPRGEVERRARGLSGTIKQPRGGEN